MFPEATNGHRLTVLIAEAYTDAAETLADLLRLFGHEVTVATSGPAALDAAALHPPDVLIVEPRLPGLDGWEVARRLRASEPRPLCIAVTTCGRPEDRRRSAAAGIAVHLLKPAEPDTLIAILAGVARVRRGQLQLS